jgi:host factor-I protein
MPYKLQEIFLNTARKNKVRVVVYLINSVRLQGVIKSFDTYTILLEDGKNQTLVFKHAISNIVPQEKISLSFLKSEEEAGEKQEEG